MVKDLVKNFLCFSDSRILQYWLPYYRFNLTPGILSFLCAQIEATRTIPGPIVEVGCAYGGTTVFLNKHMDALDIEKPYYCLDTFRGFTATDIAYEQEHRNKRNREFLKTTFSANSKQWFEKTMEINGIRRVRAIQADINDFDFAGFRDISVCFVDVDLYRPVASALRKVYPLMAPGGIIVVDDCAVSQNDGSRDHYDGAYEAYVEFMRGLGLPAEIACSKVGVLRTPQR